MVKDNGREPKDRGTWESETKKKLVDRQTDGPNTIVSYYFSYLLLKKILKQKALHFKVRTLILGTYSSSI